MTPPRGVEDGQWRGEGGFARLVPSASGSRPRPSVRRSPTEITISPERIVVRSKWTGETWALDRAQVEQVALVPFAGRVPWTASVLPRGIAFVLVGGGAWDIVMRPDWLREVLQALGWPVDPDAVLTWSQALAVAVPSQPVVPSRFGRPLP